MTIKGLLLRFFLGYLALLIGAGLTLSYFGIKGGSWVNTGILIGLVYWVCMSFGQKNKRYFTKNEKIATVLGIIAIDLLLQFVLSAAALSGTNSNVGAGPLVFALGFVGLLHALVIYYFVGSSKKLLIKQNIITD
jgi:hypothetical protein